MPRPTIRMRMSRPMTSPHRRRMDLMVRLLLGLRTSPHRRRMTTARLRPVQQPLRVPPSAPARLVVLASGTGSLLESLLEAAVDDYPGRIVAVGTDRACRALEIAAAASLPAYTVRLGDFAGRDAWDGAMTEA